MRHGLGMVSILYKHDSYDYVVPISGNILYHPEYNSAYHSEESRTEHMAQLPSYLLMDVRYVLHPAECEGALSLGLRG